MPIPDPSPSTPAATTAPATATPAAAAPVTTAAAAADPIDVQTLAEQMAEASETGQTKEVARIRAILDGRNTAAVGDVAAGDGAATADDGALVVDDADDTAADADLDAGDSAATGDADPDPADPDADPADPLPAGDDPALDLPKKLPERIRLGHLTKEEQAQQTAIHALTMGGMTLREAQQRVMGGAAPASDIDSDWDSQDDAGTHSAGSGRGAPLQPKQPAAAPSQALADLETEVVQLEQELENAGATEGVFNTDIAKLTAKLSRATARLESQRSSEQSAAREVQRDQAAHGTQVKASEVRAFKSFPAAQDKASPLYGRFLEKCLAANHPSHPDHERSFAADAPEYFLAKAAEEMGIKPAANGRTGPVPPASAVRGPTNGAARPANGNPAPVTRPAPGTKTSTPPPPPKTSAQRVAEKYAEVEAIETGHKPGGRPRIGGLITL